VLRPPPRPRVGGVRPPLRGPRRLLPPAHQPAGGAPAPAPVHPPYSRRLSPVRVQEAGTLAAVRRAQPLRREASSGPALPRQHHLPHRQQQQHHHHPLRARRAESAAGC
jgi:hypothetical protein